jgi:hypothetical protein
MLDLQMPKKNGFQVLKAVTQFYKDINNAEPYQVIEPKIVFLTSYSTPVFKKHIA